MDGEKAGDSDASNFHVSDVGVPRCDVFSLPLAIWTVPLRREEGWQRAVRRPLSALHAAKLETDGARRVEVNGSEVIASAEVQVSFRKRKVGLGGVRR